MSGHSKWANIRVKKTAQDKKRGKIFTRHAKLIEIATREGESGDPAGNPRLKTAIENARADNVPNENIQRAIKKGTGELKGEQMSEILYAAYGPGGAAFLIECLTDNRNRTINNVRSAIEKHGGKWAESGSVLFMFDRKGVVIARNGKLKIDNGKLGELELALIDLGADDIEVTEENLHVTTNASKWPGIRDMLKAQGFEIEGAGLRYVAKVGAPIGDLETAKKLMAFMEAIEEDDDVSAVHTNAEISEEVAQKL